MKLSEFSSLMVEDSNSAKNLLSLLIGHYRVNEEYGRAINALYESLSEKIKKEEKVFEPIIYKYFLSYSVEDYNYSLYQTYSKHWSAEKLKIIQDANPDFEKIQTKIEYKNSLVFTKAVGLLLGHREENLHEVFDFLKDEEETINKLIKKDKNKLISNFLKHNVWVLLLNNDYHKFKEFCQRHSFDYLDIIKQFKEHTYEISYYLNAYKNRSSLKKNIIEFLEDIGIKDGENNKDYFFKQKTESISILDIVGTLIRTKEFDIAYEIIEKFPLDITLILEKLHIKKEEIDFKSPNFCEYAFSEYYTYYNRKSLNDYNIKEILEQTKDFSKYVQLAKFSEKLPEKEHNKTHKSGIKI